MLEVKHNLEFNRIRTNSTQLRSRNKNTTTTNIQDVGRLIHKLPFAAKQLREVRPDDPVHNVPKVSFKLG